MNTEKTYTSAAGAARDYFGSESAQSFMQEWKQLTDKDKQEIKEGLGQVGYKFSDTPAQS